MKAKFAFLGIFAASLVFAHFGVLTTDKNVVEDQKDATLKLNLEFSHPFLQESMNLQKPTEFGVFIDGEKKSLLSGLKEQKKGENSYFTAEFKADKPSLLAFYFDPKPYAEPAERKMIRHITKTYVDAYGAGEFSFVMPVAGWWGFAALSEEEAAKGSEQPVNELGAVLWIKADELKK